jgi:hypothetical protein
MFKRRSIADITGIKEGISVRQISELGKNSKNTNIRGQYRGAN